MERKQVLFLELFVIKSGSSLIVYENALTLTFLHFEFAIKLQN